jgi:hypothetical protein
LVDHDELTVPGSNVGPHSARETIHGSAQGASVQLRKESMELAANGAG